MTHLLAQMCPDCGAHLADSWDADAGECSRCGFAYVVVDNSNSSSRPAREDPLAVPKRLYAGLAAVTAGMLAGMAVSESRFVREVGTEGSEATAIAIATPDAAFWVSFACFGIACLLVIYAANAGGERR